MSAIVEKGRISARLDTVSIERLQRAADLSGATLDQFVVQAAMEKADQVIDHKQTIFYSREDAALFIDMLDNPRPANAKLVRAFERYMDEVTNGALDSAAGGVT
ncbi:MULTISPECIES: type II toxin-antitoxin system TacA family antitoxin [Duganella]|jgi:uncharacterized protein (DUF1778 family)|uniref:type II toxin-antitoxin system TacA family antitoxin n=1 Tax=Duganella TaxID=75654 RepID=UPI00159E9B04